MRRVTGLASAKVPALLTAKPGKVSASSMMVWANGFLGMRAVPAAARHHRRPHLAPTRSVHHLRASCRSALVLPVAVPLAHAQFLHVCVVLSRSDLPSAGNASMASAVGPSPNHRQRRRTCALATKRSHTYTALAPDVTSRQGAPAASPRTLARPAASWTRLHRPQRPSKPAITRTPSPCLLPCLC